MSALYGMKCDVSNSNLLIRSLIWLLTPPDVVDAPINRMTSRTHLLFLTASMICSSVYLYLIQEIITYTGNCINAAQVQLPLCQPPSERSIAEGNIAGNALKERFCNGAYATLCVR